MNQTNSLWVFRNTCKKYKPNEFLNEQDFNIIISLFNNHPSWDLKKGCGVEKIQVIKDKWNHLCYIIHRKDMSTTDISFVIAARGFDGGIKQRIRGACRNAIVPIILEFKRTIKFGITKCPITGELLEEHKTHIEHYDLEFKDIFNKWISQFLDINIFKKYLNNPKEDNIIEDIFIDEDIRNSFIVFHNANTKLRAVTREANLSILKSKKRQHGNTNT